MRFTIIAIITFFIPCLVTGADQVLENQMFYSLQLMIRMTGLDACMGTLR